jgi:dTDP-4-dehydrorhamnose reductase
LERSDAAQHERGVSSGRNSEKTYRDQMFCFSHQGAGVMRFLVLGASGMLGNPLSKAIARAGYTCLAHCNSARVTDCLRADLLERGAIRRLIKETQPDVVANLVALTSVDDCEADIDRAYRLNAEIPDVVSDVACPAVRVIQISTDHVYDGPGHKPNAEAETRLTNVYALTKRAGELPVLARGGVVLRTNFFGPSSTLGRVSFSDAIHKALTNGEPVMGFDDVYFNPISMARLADEILRVATSWHPGLYNLGSKTAMSKLDFARQVAKCYGHDANLIGALSLGDAGLKAPRPLGMVMDVTAFEQAYEVSLPSLEQEIRDLEN